MFYSTQIPVPGDGEEGGPSHPARRLLNRSFAAVRARKQGNADWVESRLSSVVAARDLGLQQAGPLTWVDQLAARAGVHAEAVVSLKDWFLKGAFPNYTTVPEWLSWALSWLQSETQLIPKLIRAEPLESAFGSDYKSLTDDEALGRHALPRISMLMDHWIRGVTFVAMERAIGIPEKSLKKCAAARQFAAGLVPEMAFIFSLPSQVFRELAAGHNQGQNQHVSLDLLGACVRGGFDHTDTLALHHLRRPRPCRVAIHREVVNIEPHVEEAPANESIGAAIGRIARADRAAKGGLEMRQ